jgi:hypothetical protein
MSPYHTRRLVGRDQEASGYPFGHRRENQRRRKRTGPCVTAAAPCLRRWIETIYHYLTAGGRKQVTPGCMCTRPQSRGGCLLIHRFPSSHVPDLELSDADKNSRYSSVGSRFVRHTPPVSTASRFVFQFKRSPYPSRPVKHEFDLPCRSP